MTSKLRCDGCGKPQHTLGSYGNGLEWICLKCFEVADARAASEDRWPDARDLDVLRKKKGGPKPSPHLR